MYQVIGSPRTRTIRVVWALEELGLEYEWQLAPPRSEAAFASNPSGKVPSLVVDGVSLTDSVAITQFLADRHGGMTNAAGTIERGLQDGFTQFAVDEIEGPLWLAGRHSFILPEDLRVPQVKVAARAEFARSLEILEQRLDGREFVMGETFTVPDLILGHCARWAEMAKFDLPAGVLGAYFERMRARPALARAMAAGEAL
jgi:glutathione S-transferase